ncbi:MFS transporter [Butyrivibrio sp. MC2013]|uniref:MFS transporter n=1 Tax=Butyrivibrio sp. MC2013 TaxID=1280686 RepID=UPI00041FC98F|nr:MFS transporter [Butyrivibrio sp. MC2013]
MASTREEKDSSFLLLLLINSFVYIPQALFIPYLNPWFEAHGADMTQIGILSVFSPIASVLIQPLWARMSDKSGKAKKYAAIVAFGASLALCTYYINMSIVNFYIASILLALFTPAIIPLIDAIVIRSADRQLMNFAWIRMGGSLGYMVVVVIAGQYLKHHPDHLFALGAGGYFILFLLLLMLPARENRIPTAASRQLSFKGIRKTMAEIFTDKTIYLVLFFAFVFQIGYCFFYTFFGVFFSQQGYSQGQLGIMSCISAFSEAPILLLIRKLEKRFKPLTLLAGATVLIGVRLLLTSTGLYPVFIIVECMQGMTSMVVYYSCATFIASHVLKGKSSEGQAVLYMVQAGFASMIGSVIGGRLSDLAGIRPAFIIMGLVTIVLSSVTYIVITIYAKRKGNN